MKKILLMAILSITLVNCKNDDDNNNEEPFTPQVITPVLIAQSDYGGLNIPVFDFYNTYFNTQENWDAFVESSLLNPSLSDDIDFNEDTVIVSVDYPRPTNGYSIGFYSITEYENEIITHVNYIDYGGGGTIPTRPFIIVKIPKTEKPIVFE